MATLKQMLGCWLHERWKTEVVLHRPAARLTGWRWEDLCNRNERLQNGEAGARRCLWEYSSCLTVCRLFPSVGGRLLEHCRREWPLDFSSAPSSAPSAPRISIVLPIAGRDRIPLFQCVLSAFFAQTARDAIELIVVEHDSAAVYRDLCPPGVRYLALPRPPGREFSRSLAFNSGAKQARAPYLLLHDSDALPPVRYVESLLRRLDGGWDAVRPMRLLFMLDEKATREFIASGGTRTPTEVMLVQQNASGLALAISAQAYREIGGHDETFEGWGGEDQEFDDRLQTRRLCPGGYVPLIHLWHPPAPKKASGDGNIDLAKRQRRVPVEDRIRQLRARYAEGGAGS